MLVLARKPGEYVMIGKDIMVKVVKGDGKQLRLVIDAPKDLNITRGEIFEDKTRYIPQNG
ncbi:MAG: carbon storage regulator [Sporomusaceae bacterium]|nr:carbon storage regulator [Sporomusaceae bacterium]